MQDIENDVSQICYPLPKLFSLKARCQKLLKSKTEHLIDLICNTENPETVCTRARFCQKVQALPQLSTVLQCCSVTINLLSPTTIYPEFSQLLPLSLWLNPNKNKKIQKSIIYFQLERSIIDEIKHLKGLTHSIFIREIALEHCLITI